MKEGVTKLQITTWVLPGFLHLKTLSSRDFIRRADQHWRPQISLVRTACMSTSAFQAFLRSALGHDAHYKATALNGSEQSETRGVGGGAAAQPLPL